MSTKNRFDPDWCMRPGVHLQELIDYSGLTGDSGVRMVSKLSGLDPEVVRGILSGTQRITKPIAEPLHSSGQDSRLKG